MFSLQISFRRKILLSYLGVFIICLGLLFPFASHSVKTIAAQALLNRAVDLVERVQTAPDDEALIRRLKDQKQLIFFRTAIINDQQEILWDSHLPKVGLGAGKEIQVAQHPEVVEAFEDGVGHREDYSEALRQRFVYVAKAFSFHGKTYVLRTAFPYEYVQDLSRDFETGFLLLGGVALMLFSLMTLVLFERISSPIRHIIEAIQPYQEGKQELVPHIDLDNRNSTRDFVRLADTLNSLSARMEEQITNLTGERNEKAAILESMVEGVISVEPNLNLRYANRAARGFFPSLPKNVLGMPIQSLPVEEAKILLETCQKEQQVLTETIELSNPGKVYLDLVAAPMGDGKGAVLVMVDNTVQHRVMEMRKDFIANASHELRTPITIIRGFAETLFEHDSLPPEQVKNITGTIVRNCDRMVSLVKNLLMLSDIENLPPSSLSDLFLLDLVKDCIKTTQRVYTDAQISLDADFERDYRLVGQPDLLLMAITNLLTNAAKYSKAPAEISVILEETPEDLILAISDKGMGIPEADKERVFRRFHRVDKARSSKVGGTGLGLSLVKTIVEKHRGKVELESTLGEGSTFTIRLPKKMAE